MDSGPWEDYQPKDASGDGPWTAYQQPQDEGAAMAAGRAALRNLPGAQQITAGLESGPYENNLQDLTTKAEAAKAAHPWAYGAGAVGGAAAPAVAGALIPPLGAAMTASYPAAMGSGALLGAAQAISDTPLDKNPGQIAKTAAGGAAAGAVGGAAGQWLGNLAPTPEEMDTGALLQKLNLPSRGGAATLGNNIVEGAEDLAGTMRTPTPSGGSLNNLNDFALRNAGQVNRAIDEYGKQIGGVVDQVGKDLPVNPEFLKQAIADLKDDSMLPIRNQHLETITQAIDDAVDKQGNLTLGKLRDLTRDIYKELVNEDPQTGKLLPGSEKALDAWKLLRGFQDDIVKSERPDLLPTFQSSNKNYSNLVGLQKALNRVGVAAEKKQTTLGGWFNPLGLFSKGANAIGSATGANRLANNLPFKMMPAVNAVRGAIPGGLPQAEMTDLASYLENKFKK